jgi:hypothetical protein
MIFDRNSVFFADFDGLVMILRENQQIPFQAVVNEALDGPVFRLPDGEYTISVVRKNHPHNVDKVVEFIAVTGPDGALYGMTEEAVRDTFYFAEDNTIVPKAMYL